MVQRNMLRRQVGTVLVLLALLVLMAACGGNSGPATADAAAVDTGVPLTAGDWEVELIKPTEKIKVVGSGDITYQAEGDFVVVFATVTNHSGEMQMVGRSLFVVRDSAGQEYTPVKSAVQVAYVLEHGMELSLDSPLAGGTSRDSVVIFDVPSDATGLHLGLDGTDATLKLGF
jgi:ABC-type Fe3+-hydroxamate transport system substrate-binding protein